MEKPKQGFSLRCPLMFTELLSLNYSGRLLSYSLLLGFLSLFLVYCTNN